MTKYLYLLLLILPLTVFAQVNLSFNQGFGLYNMKDMKRLQTEASNGMPVKTQQTMKFPGYWYYELSGQWLIDDEVLIGGSLSYGSTAGRISYSDYSGSINFDQLLKFYGISASIGKSMKLDNEKTWINADLKPNFMLTYLNIEFNESIGQQNRKKNYGFSSTNIALQPTISIHHPLSRFVLQGSLGYHINLISGKLYFDEIDKAYLQDSHDKPVYANWSGVRLAIGIGYLIGNKD